MEYKLRELNTGDIFKMSRILQKLELKIDFNDTDTDLKEEIEKAEIKNETRGKISELIFKVGENLYKAEDEVSEFMADLMGLTSDEFKKIPLAEMGKLFKKFKGLKGISDFFKLAGQSTK